MNDEIKEILDFKEDADYKRLSVDEITILRDYITNLQEENEHIKVNNKETHDFDETMKDIKDNLIARINRQECEIHNLKEANCKLRKGGETLKDTNKLLLQQKGQLQEDLDMLDKRIDKAIEYIDKNNLTMREKIEYCNDIGIFDEFVGKVDRLLRGCDKE